MRTTFAGARANWPASSPRRARPIGSPRRSPSAIRTAPISPPPLLLLHPDALAGAALMRAIAPFREPPKVDLAGKPVLLLSGEGDPMAPAESAGRLAATLTGAGAIVRREFLPTGHQLSEADVALARDWLARL